MNHDRSIGAAISEWVEEVLSRIARERAFPLVIGINGPQGCGKSTAARAVVESLRTKGRRAVALSVDDFYLPRELQLELASRYPMNRYLQQRGYPGTHDVKLGVATLEALKGVREGMSVLCPVYDKSKFEGQGDRLPRSEWKEVCGPLDVVLLEGWMLGFKEVSGNLLQDAELKESNQFLRNYESWYQLLDGFVQVAPEDIHFVLDWRVEAEERMKAEGKAGMEKEEVLAYVRKFLPAYEIYLPKLLKSYPCSEVYLCLRVSKERKVN